MKAAGLWAALTLAVGGSLAPAAQAAEPVFVGKAQIGAVVAPVSLVTASGVAYLEEESFPQKVECSASTGSGTATGPKTIADLVITFTGCHVAGEENGCDNVEPIGTREIMSQPLTGELGPITSTLPGLRLRPESGSYLAKFTCRGGTTHVEAKGSLIASLSGASGLNVEEAKLSSTLKLSFVESGGIQKYTHFLTGPSEQLTIFESHYIPEDVLLSTEEPGGLNVTQTVSSMPFKGALGVTK